MRRPDDGVPNPWQAVPLIPALRREIHALVRHCAADSAAPLWRMVDQSPALREYEESMRLRHAQALAAAIAEAG